MFEAIYEFFAVVFGFIMNYFYLFLDFLGLPYLWLCIVLFAATSRLISLPQKIGSVRKSILAPRINYEIRQLRRKYGSISKDDKDRLIQYKKDTKSIFKQFKVSSGTGCLIAVLQLPIFVGLFRVIKEPFIYVDQLSHLSTIDKANVNDFFGLSLEALPQNFGALGILVPAIVFIATLIRVLPTLLNKNTRKQPAMLIFVVVQLALMTWMSFCFPIAISLYWTVNDLTNLLIDKVVKSIISNSSETKRILAETAVLIEEEKARAQEEKEIEAAEAQKMRHIPM